MPPLVEWLKGMDFFCLLQQQGLLKLDSCLSCCILMAAFCAAHDCYLQGPKVGLDLLRTSWSTILLFTPLIPTPYPTRVQLPNQAGWLLAARQFDWSCCFVSANECTCLIRLGGRIQVQVTLFQWINASASLGLGIACRCNSSSEVHPVG